MVLESGGDKQASQKQMLLRTTIPKTKNFFHKTLHNLMSFLIGVYQKFPKAPSLNPFSSSSSRYPKTKQLNTLYRQFFKRWESDHVEVMQRKKKSKITMKEAMSEENASSRTVVSYAEQSVAKNNTQEGGREEKKTRRHSKGKRGETCSPCANGGSHILAQKMKELEMMDMNDVDHVLDIEEVLHYYSRLTCPVYLDIVDEFFMVMYYEFLIRQPSVTINNSAWRLGPLKL